MKLWFVQLEADEQTDYTRKEGARRGLPPYIKESPSEEPINVLSVKMLERLIESRVRFLLHRFNASEQVWEFIKSRKLQLGFIRVMEILFGILPNAQVRFELSEDPEDPDFSLIAIEVDVSSPQEALRVSREFAKRRADLPDDQWLAFCLVPNVRRSNG